MSESRSITQAQLDALAALLSSDRQDLERVTLLSTYLYTPHPNLDRQLAIVRKHAFQEETLGSQEAGKALESLAALCVAGLQGFRNFSSVRTPDAQLDLLVAAGDSPHWIILTWLLGMEARQKSIVVECKCFSRKERTNKHGRRTGRFKNTHVETHDYERLGAIMTTSLAETAGLGLMFSLWGGTGEDGRTCLKDSRLFRVKLHTRHNLAIVNVTLEDIEKHAMSRGGFLRLLLDRIHDLSVQSKVHVPEGLEGIRQDVPQHITDALHTEN